MCDGAPASLGISHHGAALAKCMRSNVSALTAEITSICAIAGWKLFHADSRFGQLEGNFPREDQVCFAVTQLHQIANADARHPGFGIPNPTQAKI